MFSLSGTFFPVQNVETINSGLLQHPWSATGWQPFRVVHCYPAENPLIHFLLENWWAFWCTPLLQKPLSSYIIFCSVWRVTELKRFFFYGAVCILILKLRLKNKGNQIWMWNSSSGFSSLPTLCLTESGGLISFSSCMWWVALLQVHNSDQMSLKYIQWHFKERLQP